MFGDHLSRERLMVGKEYKGQTFHGSIKTHQTESNLKYGRFDTTNLPSVEDAALEDLCLKEGERRGYDLDVLKTALTVGLTDIAASAYHHISNVNVKVFTAFYTAFVTYFDDAYPDDPDALVGVPNFTKHFAASEKQSTKMQDDLANLLAQASQLFGQVAASFIVHAGLKFIAVLLSETQNKNESMDKVDTYALYLREMSGLGEAYAMFIFPTELPYNTYVQALPLLRDFIDFTNDITSFYKEECEGETDNLISFLAEARGGPKSKALYYLAGKTMEAHERILLILSPHTDSEAQGPMTSMSSSKHLKLNFGQSPFPPGHGGHQYPRETHRAKWRRHHGTSTPPGRRGFLSYHLSHILEGPTPPDIIFLQEVTRDVGASLLNDAGVRPALLVTDAADETSFEGVPFATTTLLSSARFGDGIKGGGKVMLGDTLPYRAQQIKILAEVLREPGCGGGIVAGDFNALSRQDEALVDENGLVDAWVALHGKAAGAIKIWDWDRRGWTRLP
ncbi:hypothetical protein F5146DRAFT_1210165 [Armillaria mellea]|nr:hypothetical protein F5146DRAFT_1210165 [Armillaria mellea]